MRSPADVYGQDIVKAIDVTLLRMW